MKNAIKMVLVLAAQLSAGLVNAEVTVDGSLNSTGIQAVGSGNGFTYDITEDLGQVQGSNLFHSFEAFNIGATESANFSGQSSISNIIARVTGGQSSSIAGAVSSSIDGASFWFINPAGVVIGEGASFDFDGSIHIGTASYLKFEDGLEYSATDLGSLPNLTFEPAAFGFIGDGAMGDLRVDGASLMLADQQSFSAYAKNLTVTESALASETGSIKLFSVGNQTLDVSAEAEAFEATRASGDLTVINSVVDVSGPIGGLISLNGGNVALDNAQLKSDSEQDYAQGMEVGLVAVNANAFVMNNGSDIFAQANAANFVSDILISADKSIEVSGSGTIVFSNPFLDGSVGGELTMTAPSIRISDSAFLTGEAKQSAIGGNISLIGERIVLTSEVIVSLDRKLNSSGGQLLLRGDTVEVSQGANIVADAFGTSLGANLRIETRNLLVSDPLTSITAQTTDNTGAGIDIFATGNLTVANDGLIGTESFGSGLGSNINVNAKSITVTSGGQIDASALNSGRGGNIRLTAQDAIVIDGAGSNERVTEISSKSGDIDREENLKNNAGYGEGTGGTITLLAETIALDNGARVTSSAERLDDSFVVVGDAGEINIGDRLALVSRLSIENGSSVRTNAPFSRGGNISIYVDELLRVADSEISAFAGSNDPSASGGDIFIDPQLLIFDNAIVNANANAGNGGNIDIIAQDIIQNPETRITASSSSGVDGEIQVSGLTNDVSSLETSEVAFADVSKMLSQRCNIAALSERSSFIITSDESDFYTPEAYQLASLGGAAPVVSYSNDDAMLQLAALGCF